MPSTDKCYNTHNNVHETVGENKEACTASNCYGNIFEFIVFKITTQNILDVSINLPYKALVTLCCLEPSLDQKCHNIISFLLIARWSMPARGAAGNVRRVQPPIIIYTTCVGVNRCSVDMSHMPCEVGLEDEQNNKWNTRGSVRLSETLLMFALCKT